MSKATASESTLTHPGIHKSESRYRLLESSRNPSTLDTTHSRWAVRFEGWRTGASTAATLALLSLLINFGVVMWLGTKQPGGALVEVYHGSCGTVAKVDVWVHLAINVLSTLLLGGSNYCMQCLCAPTRAEIDRAHAKGKYLDIGVPSIRNLWAIPRSKALLWWALGLSSIPLHLMYNSSFFKSLATNDYNYLIVTEEFVGGATFNNSYYDEYVQMVTDQQELIGTQRATSSGPDYYQIVDAKRIQTELPEYNRIDPVTCLKSYASSFLSNKRHLILVTSEVTIDPDPQYQTGYYTPGVYGTVLGSSVNVSTRADDPLFFQDAEPFDIDYQFDWICSSVPDAPTDLDATFSEIVGQCPPRYKKWLPQIDRWKPLGQNIEYCLSEPVQERCAYTANVPIIAVVIISNFIKLVAMYIVATQLHDNPLITIGDAIESFLDTPDPSTKGMCLLSRHQVRRKLWPARGSNGDNDTTNLRPLALPASLQRLQWVHAASRTRWATTTGLLLAAIVVSLGLFGMAMNAITDTGASIASLGLGRVDAAAIIQSWSIQRITSPTRQIMAAVLIANLPQTILSFLYLQLNGLLTSMWLASEYADFAKERKTLRVSNAKAGQRSTHFLQLPYKVALPLMTMSGLLHWLLSQSIFLAVVAEYNSNGILVNRVAVASCGFSPLAMLLTASMGVALVVGTGLLGWYQRLSGGGMPLAGSCSAAISAACWRPGWDEGAARGSVRWGVVPAMESAVGGQIVRHCCFTSGDVDVVKAGGLYT
ncbi:uncharacterized protein HMPREF1541_04172 [Cyphellophora europaea CBS 101466]|uniref:DUF6536 domain-containing protein n=1 Tax=Cyphellophora europaea (strain CBS 101466) TaxID=1220924 RepID=W2S0H1_CYPE1|nr:uncharacterized protein HMPREF1541_04172 [Cyphellophora europaea CBS 101466]ETN42231.1 hypothetical protein HMPREF1541_04172 [Cyphellophora europaea CBS 101466]